VAAATPLSVARRRRGNLDKENEMKTVGSVSLEDARRVIAAGEAKAIEIGQPMNIAVADTGGNLVAHIRMDGAMLGSIDISINKAFTARAFNMSTAEMAVPPGVV
jgi:uncharacterized protein GlcG (DUF336 family)